MYNKLKQIHSFQQSRSPSPSDLITKSMAGIKQNLHFRAFLFAFAIKVHRPYGTVVHLRHGTGTPVQCQEEEVRSLALQRLILYCSNLHPIPGANPSTNPRTSESGLFCAWEGKWAITVSCSRHCGRRLGSIAIAPCTLPMGSTAGGGDQRYRKATLLHASNVLTPNVGRC
jgi:hypothetical protein